MAEAKRLKARLARIERGEPGWQGTEWFLKNAAIPGVSQDPNSN